MTRRPIPNFEELSKSRVPTSGPRLRIAASRVGPSLVLVGTFSDAGKLVEPDYVRVRVQGPDGTWIDPEPTPTSAQTGLWSASFLAADPGEWLMEMEGELGDSLVRANMRIKRPAA